MLKKLPLSDAAKDVTDGHLDRFPPLIMDKCLSGSMSTLVPVLVARFSGGTSVHNETLTMPRRGFSPRPVTITDPATRVLYTALVTWLGAELPNTKGTEDWQRHEKFGAMEDPWGPEYLVEFDIASCYEYIEHQRLRNELILRTSDTRHVEPCVELLGELYPKGRGLPQLSRASDALAYTYLEILERAMLRTGEAVSRFADDFKIRTATWESATALIEVAAEEARRLGWILAADKTHVWKRRTIVARRDQEERFLNEYFKEAQQALTTIDFLMGGGYGWDVVEVPPDSEVTVREALRRIFEAWYRQETATDAEHGPSIHAQYLPAALALLASAPERLPDEWLLELVFRQPLRLEGVCNYFEGSAHLAAQDPAASTASVTIQVASITTGNDQRDGHLRTNDFFDAPSFPTITFTSTSVEVLGPEEFRLNGELTIKGVTKAISIDFEHTGTAKDPYGNLRAGFDGKALLTRSDFGISYFDLKNPVG